MLTVIVLFFSCAVLKYDVHLLLEINDGYIKNKTSYKDACSALRTNIFYDYLQISQLWFDALEKKILLKFCFF